MRKKNNYLKVFAVYSPETESYPYYPFTGMTIYDGIKQFINFLVDREKVCPNPQLHIIATCKDINGSLYDIQPLVCPKQIVLKKNLATWSIVYMSCLTAKVAKYLSEKLELIK